MTRAAPGRRRDDEEAEAAAEPSVPPAETAATGATPANATPAPTGEAAAPVDAPATADTGAPADENDPLRSSRSSAMLAAGLGLLGVAGAAAAGGSGGGSSSTTPITIDPPKPEQPKPEEKPDPKPEPQSDPKPDPKPEPQPDPKPDPKPEPQPDPKPDPKPEPQPDPKPDPKPEPQPDPKPDPKPEPQPDPKPDPKPEPQPDPKPEPQPDPKPDPKPEPEPDPKPDPKPEPEPEPDPKPDPKPEPDTEPPAAPVLALMNDTGTSGFDRVTRDATVLVSGLEPNASWRYSLDNGQTWRDGKDGAIPASAFTHDGDWKVLVRQADAAGNHSEVRSLEFKLLTSAAKPTLRLSEDTGATVFADPAGISLHDGVTRDATVLVANLDPNAKWQYSMDGLSWFEGRDGRVEPGFFGDHDGAKIVHVRQLDTAGNISQIETLQFVLDTKADGPAVVRLVNDSGVSSTDWLTNDGRLELVLAPGKTFSYTFDTGHWGSGGGAAGNIVPMPADLPDGARWVDLRVYDGAGNGTLQRVNFQLDRTPPPKLGATLLNDTGASATDGITQDATIQVTGLTAGNRWQYRIATRGDQWFDGDDSMRIENSAYGGDGVNWVDIAQVDAAGNRSEFTHLRFELDRVAQAPKVWLKDDTGASASDFFTADSTVVIGGLEAGASWWATGLNGATYSGTALGTLNSEVAVPPLNGSIRFRARQTDLAGNTSDFSTVLQAYVTTKDVADARRPVLRSGESKTMSGTDHQDTFVIDATGLSQDLRITNYSREQNDVLDLSHVVTLVAGQKIGDRVRKEEIGSGALGVELTCTANDGTFCLVAMWNTSGSDTILIRTADGLHVL
ncbi:hypothetical protein FHT39_000854 [Mitsuaria sp. BK045]|uniref:Ig-like domain-containing protein n=1 Tax=unclassified Roseateles TaxID=2626991 RepID=UPI00160E81DE|nr:MULTISPECIES: Ig-like domain-containing protein [unclassified Roseateles]MBB3292215.1 hypothetical protein [Mitsuaria sp. BK041]MBB3361432.1 hypothetical protein [Mitsuaria sp. BK045]